jgi:hypothetical protein
MTYGKSTPTANTDPEVVAMKRVVERFGIVMQPGAFLVDRIPILRYVPWYGRQLKAWFREEHELVLGQMERVKMEIVIRVSIAMCVLCAHSLSGKWYRWAVFHAYTSRATWASAIEN